ncbi:MAG: RAD55 family ATPase [archaeon]
MDALSTGIPSFDKLIGGGIPKGYNIVLVGEPGTKKSLLSQHFAREHVINGGTALFVLTRKSKKTLVEELKAIGWIDCMDFFNNGAVDIVDVYSWKTGLSSSLKPRDLTRISIEINQKRKKLEQTGEPIEIFDTASEFFLHNTNEQSVFMFFEEACARARSSNAIIVFLVEEGMHSVKQLTTFKSFTQGTFELMEDTKGRYLSVQKLDAVDHPLAWFPITISEKGVKIGTKVYSSKKHPKLPV